MSLELVTWLVGEVFDAALSETWQALLNRRAQTARKILTEELQRGNAHLVDIADRDEAAAMVFEYAEAAKRGAARRNLRLIAQVLTNQVAQSPPLYADEFLRWASLLASLSREEIILASTMLRLWSHPMARSSVEGTTLAVKDELVGLTKTFPKDNEYEATAFALSRTGLIIPVSGYGGTHHEPTKRLENLARMANLEGCSRENW
jgi:hypothetical protein